MSKNGPDQPGQKKEPAVAAPAAGTTAAGIRRAAYFLLTIAAIFVINAMETGSYRTPWPVAAVTTLAGFGVLAYSFVKAKQEKNGV